MTSGDIISTHNVHSEIECLFNCLTGKRCVGFKYRSASESVNCQLSKSTGRNEHLVNCDVQGWQIFIDINTSKYGINLTCIVDM